MAELKQLYPNADIRLVPSSGGVFEVTVDGDAVTSGPKAPILLIDDDEMIRTSFAEALQDEGFGVVTANDGLEGLALLRGGLRPRFVRSRR